MGSPVACAAVRFISRQPMSSKRFMIALVVCSSLSSANVLPWRSIGSGDMPAAPTIDAARQVTDCEVAADADRVLAVEGELGSHRADDVDEVAEHLALELAEPLFLLEDWWCPSEPPRILIESRLDSRSGR